MWDQHTHTHFSSDSTADCDEMINSAISKGLDGICFTDHLDYDYKEVPGDFLLDIDAYYKEIMQLKTKYQNTFPIHWGIEIGLQPHVAEENRQTILSHPFDFVIGSTHCIDKVDIYYPDFYQGLSARDAYEKYFEAVLTNVKTYEDYDVYGHLDYIVRYVKAQVKGDAYSEFTYRSYSDIIDEILKRIIYKGKGIEMNMAGFKYGLDHPNPTEDILKRYHELGGEIITVGSDAHKPEHLAYAYDKVSSILLDAGFKYYALFENRKANMLPILSRK